jgi:N-carbamoyl-L-amino-acid hydrolase
LHVDGERLMRHFRALFEFGKTPAGGVSRVAYSDADLRAREFVMRLMRQAGLSVRIDAGGNVLGRRAGRDDSLPPLLFGSHIDSVPDGGNYDGNVGSMGALEAAWTLADRGILTRHPVEVVIFQNEEGGLIGSSLMVGELAPSVLDQQSHSGKTIREGIAALGGDMENLEAAVRRTGDVHAYLELHIEQGGLLEEADLDIGVVEGIVSIRWWNVRIEGFANHAGTTPMDQRRDASWARSRHTPARPM